MEHQDINSFMKSLDLDFLYKVNGWKIEMENDLVKFELSARDGERYIALFDCSNYPTLAPGAVFVNDKGSKMDPKAWPTGNDKFLSVVKPPPHCFLCMQLVREGLQHHPDWRTNPKVDSWDSTKHSLKDILNYLDRLLSSPDYFGRGK